MKEYNTHNNFMISMMESKNNGVNSKIIKMFDRDRFHQNLIN